MDQAWPPFPPLKKARVNPPPLMPGLLPEPPTTAPGDIVTPKDKKVWVKVMVYMALHNFFPEDPCFQPNNFCMYIQTFPDQNSSNILIRSRKKFHDLIGKFTERFMSELSDTPLKMVHCPWGYPRPAPEVVDTIKKRIDNYMKAGKRGEP